ncbi:MAG: hypothetical protein AB1512_07810 [Thermodesulfobacteriota bacterium]
MSPGLLMMAGSDFEFQIKLQGNWTVISRGDLRGKPDMIEGTFDAADRISKS